MMAFNNTRGCQCGPLGPHQTGWGLRASFVLAKAVGLFIIHRFVPLPPFPMKPRVCFRPEPGASPLWATSPGHLRYYLQVSVSMCHTARLCGFPGRSSLLFPPNIPQACGPSHGERNWEAAHLRSRASAAARVADCPLPSPPFPGFPRYICAQQGPGALVKSEGRDLNNLGRPPPSRRS
jgi:hypothetical protein